MQKTISRWVCTVMVFVVLFSAIPTFAGADSATSGNPVDFVLLLDCSRTLALNDPQNLCLAAVRNFVDTLPLQEARVAVVTFGYRNGTPYTYSAEYAVSDRSVSRIHQIVSLEQIGTPELKAGIKNDIFTEVTTKSGDRDSYTPIGHAVAAATDILTKNGSAPGSAAIILITDGDEDPDDLDTFPGALDKDLALLDAACSVAEKNKWNIYSIHLCYGLLQRNPGALPKLREFLDGISEKDGGGKIGRIECGSSEDVYIAFQRLFADMMEVDTPDPIPLTIRGEYVDFEFEVGEMCSEVTLNVFGSGATSVELTCTGSNQPPIVVNKTENRGNIMSTVENDYFQVKILCPEEGKWNARIYGKSSAQVLVNCISMTEMGLVATAVQKGANNSIASIELTKTDTVVVNAQLSYYGVVATDRQFYVDHASDAAVVIKNSDGSIVTFPMNATRDGFNCEFPLSSLSGGRHEMSVVLKYSGYRNGQKASDPLTFHITNQLVEAVNNGGTQITRAGMVNSTFPRIESAELFTNPDNDPVEYQLTCVSDRSIVFDYDKDEAKAGYLTIYTGTAVGEFEVQVEAKDPDMREPAVNTIHLTVGNNAPVIAEKIRTQEVWTSSYFWQKNPPMQIELDLNKHIVDPDKLPMTYTYSVADEGVVKVSLENGKLVITSVVEGKTVVTITGSDGIDSVSCEFKLNSVSGRKAFWRDSWIYFAIAAATLLAIVITIVVLLKNKRVKGDWQISFDENGDYDEIPSINIAHNTKSGRSSKMTVKDLFVDVAPFMPNGGHWSMVIPAYFAADNADKMELVGVIGGKGCKIVKVPTSNYVNVSVSNIPVKGSAALKNPGGSIVIRLNRPDSPASVLTVTLRLQ